MAQDLRDAALGTELNQALTLIVGWKHGAGFEAAQINVGEDVSQALRDACQTAADDARSRDPRMFDPDAALEREECLIVQLDQVGQGAPRPAILDLLEQAEALPLLGAGGLGNHTFLFYAVLIGDNPGERVCFIRKVNPHLSARRGKFFSLLTDVLDRVDQPLFAFDETFDMILFDQTLIVLNLFPFEMLFRDTPALQAQVPVWIQEMTDRLPMNQQNQQLLQQLATTDSRIRRRLQSIHARGALQNVTIQNVQNEFVAQGLNPSDYVVNGQLAIDRTNASLLLQLLNEDLFIGGLTQTPFRVDRKSAR
ncbi:MAG TPA: Kiwa anti-phage protein KwaB-like domain-containing protein [Chloroflexota bacterium]|nr:Kiwa anti-phage protein KwaB-like domain-containing protein [Chloroflexota bacterium]